MNPALGILLHAIGGLAAGSFYLPLKKIKEWAWETYWLINGFVSWILMPWIVAYITVPELLILLNEAPTSSVFWSYFYGILWGIGGLTFGLTMRFLGLSLGYAFSTLAGVTWYLQFMFYGMGSSQMGQYDFASWSIHFAFVIFFSNMWGILTKEWKGVGSKTVKLIYSGLFVLVVSACIIGYGNYLANF